MSKAGLNKRTVTNGEFGTSAEPKRKPIGFDVQGRCRPATKSEVVSNENLVGDQERAFADLILKVGAKYLDSKRRGRYQPEKELVENMDKIYTKFFDPII